MQGNISVVLAAWLAVQWQVVLLAKPLQPIVLAVSLIIFMILTAIPVPAHLVFIKTVVATVILVIQVVLLALAVPPTAPLVAVLPWDLVVAVRVLTVLLLASTS